MKKKINHQNAYNSAIKDISKEFGSILRTEQVIKPVPEEISVNNVRKIGFKYRLN